MLRLELRTTSIDERCFEVTANNELREAREAAVSAPDIGQNKKGRRSRRPAAARQRWVVTWTSVPVAITRPSPTTPAAMDIA